MARAINQLRTCRAVWHGTYRLYVRDRNTNDLLTHFVIKSDTPERAERLLTNYVAVKYPFHPTEQTDRTGSAITTYV